MPETTPVTSPAPAAPPAPTAPAAAAPAEATPAPAATPAPQPEGGLVGEALAAKPEETKPADTKPTPVELKLPEGFTADEKALEGFKTLAGELGLDSAKAQKVFDSYVAIEQSRAKALEQQYVQQDAKWRSELEADPDIGGAKLPATKREVALAAKFLGRGPLETLAKVGLGSHPDIIRALVKVGRALSDDTISGTSAPAPAATKRLSDAEIFYGTPTTAPAKEQ